LRPLATSAMMNIQTEHYRWEYETARE